MPLSQVYHREIGFPASVAHPAPHARLTYSRHALAAAGDDGLAGHDLPWHIPAVFELVEVTCFAGRVARWVVRFPLTARTGWDIVAVVSYDYHILTIFINKDTDQHATLRRERYDVPTTCG